MRQTTLIILAVLVSACFLNTAGLAQTDNSAGPDSRRTFVHPGGWQTESDIERVRSKVAAGAEPWAGAWNAIKDKDADINYKAHVAKAVTDAYWVQNDGHAAYVLAIKWVASGDIAYASVGADHRHLGFNCRVSAGHDNAKRIRLQPDGQCRGNPRTWFSRPGAMAGGKRRQSAAVVQKCCLSKNPDRGCGELGNQLHRRHDVDERVLQ